MIVIKKHQNFTAIVAFFIKIKAIAFPLPITSCVTVMAARKKIEPKTKINLVVPTFILIVVILREISSYSGYTYFTCVRATVRSPVRATAGRKVTPDIFVFYPHVVQ